MIYRYEYAGKYRWDEAKERCANDYGPPQTIHYGDKTPMTKEEEEAYYELRQREEDMTNDLIPY